MRIPIRALILASVSFFAINTSSQTLVLEHAGSNENTYTGGELINELRDSVVFRYDDVTISSNYAKMWQRTGVVDFSDRVKITRSSQRLTCDRMRYTRSDSTLLATGRVTFVDTAQLMQISGDRCRYLLNKRRCYLTGSPRLVRRDTTAGDTLTIDAREMSYDDSSKTTTAVDDVVIRKGLLLTRCKKAYYHTDREIARLRISPDIRYDAHVLLGDSVDLNFLGDTIRSIVVMGNSRGRYSEPSGDDSTITNVRGDSIFMALNDAGYLDTVWIHRNVVATHHSRRDSSSTDEATGKAMQLAFAGKSEIRETRIWGNATSIYHVEGEDGGGRNEASGDTLSVWFEDGRAKRLRLTGNVRGTYFPR